MPVFHSGRLSSVYVVTSTSGSHVELANVSWSVNETQEMAQFRNSLTGVNTLREPTFRDCTFSITTDHRYDLTPFATNSANLGILNQGSNSTHVQLIYDSSQGTNSSFWDFPAAYMTGVSASNAVEGKPTETFNMVASGAWVEPV